MSTTVLGPLHVGAASPTYYPLVTVTSTGHDLTEVTSATVRARKPGGDEISWAGALPGPQTTGSCPVQWTLAANDIDVPGAWRVEIDLFTDASPTAPIYTHAIAMPVKARFELPNRSETMSGAGIHGKAVDSASAGLDAAAGAHIGVAIEHTYHVECWRDGVLVWEDEFHNLVTTAGKNKYLDATIKTGLASPAWYVGLVTGPGSGNTYAAADTMGSHAGWAEDATYSNSTRPAYTPGSISGGSVDNSASKAVFTINGTATIAGAFMADNSTKSGSTGTLLGVGNFSGGDRAVQNGDTLNVTVTASIS